ncbi:hypothetical protein QWY87_12410 [Lutimonas halocynthiae]|uniref:hypothetical protein n=1 Tax=Lutimonas halocynthiae TaxID=1446477 RepID=UPI0025B5F241|nr:hypothetical protein [Lutimonas halocynthiae]MDN3643510.1 hypothetical protein [Lutimonas halocynthiae]
MFKIKKKAAATNAELERGKEILFSLKILMNVLFTLLIFQTFLILPRPEDPDLEYFTLEQIFAENIPKLTVMLVGLILIGIYWIQINKQLGNLVRSSGVHASVGLAQMVCLMLYLYFVRFDMEFDGLSIALQMQSVFLALAGLLGVFNWFYARSNKLTSDQINDSEEKRMFYQMLPEPLAALFSLPFATMGGEVWSLSFLIILPLSFIFNKISK